MILLKKHNSILIIASTLLLLSACSTKPCRCYLLTKWGNVPVTETYIDKNTPCSELGYSKMNPDDSSYRYCTETEDPEMDTMDIVRMFWD